MRVVVVALLLVLAACGGGSDPAPQVTKTTPAATKSTAKPTIAPPGGTPAPEALSKFLCGPNKKGAWGATGYVSNAGKKKATYQVTVYIGPATGGSEKAKTRQVVVAAGGSAKFVIHQIPAPDDGGVCHVQVLVTS